MKISKINRWAFIFLPLWPLLSFAGKEIGNGGDAIVCNDGKVLLLDYYEAEKRGFTIFIPGNTLSEKVDELSSRYVSMGALGMNNWSYHQRIKEFKDDLIFSLENPDNQVWKRVRFSNELLTDIPDSNETSIPANCTKEQLIIRKDPEQMFPGDAEFEIRADLWAKMDLNNQAMAINHEILYWGTTVALGAEDSRAARYVNGVVAAGPGSFDPAIYVATINKFFNLFKHFKFKYPNSPWERNLGAIYKLWTSEKSEGERVYYQVDTKQADLRCLTFADCLAKIDISYERPYTNPLLVTRFGVFGGLKELIIEADRDKDQPFSFNFTPGSGELNFEFIVPSSNNKSYLDYVKFDNKKDKNRNFIKITETRGQLIMEGANFIDHCRVNGIIIANATKVIFNDPVLSEGRSYLECY